MVVKDLIGIQIDGAKLRATHTRENKNMETKESFSFNSRFKLEC